MTTKVFITSGTGYIGREVARAYKKKGFEVTALVRSQESQEKAQKEGFLTHHGDITKPETYENILKNYDIVIHTASTNDERYADADKSVVETVLKQLKDTKKTFVYTSGTWVYGNTEKRVDENNPTQPINLVAWRVELEKQVQAAAKQLRTIVVRPAIVYGANRGIVAELFRDAQKNNEARYFGNEKSRWSTVHVEDLADLYLLLTEKAESGSLYNATDEKPIETSEVAKEIATAAGHAGKTKVYQTEEAQKRFGPWAEGLSLDQNVDSSKARKELGWNPRRNIIEDIKKEQKALASAR